MSTVTSPTGRRFRRSVDSEATQAGAGRGSYLAVLLLLSLFAWAPLLYPGYLQVHSGFLPLFNLADLAASPNKLSWLPTVGIAPDLLRGEGPLAWWLALPLRTLAGDIGAVKGVFALSIVALGLGTFAWARRTLSGGAGDSAHSEDSTANLPALLATRAGLLAAAVAMLWPPLLATVYVRGALAETLFMALLPWALWALSATRLYPSCPTSHASPFTFHASRLVPAAVAGLVTAALFWTQAGLALWATALLLAWALWPGAERRNRARAAAAVGLGALLGGGLFILLHRAPGLAGPALEVASHAVYPYQLLASTWGFGVSTAGWQDGLPLHLGFAALALAALTIMLSFGNTPHVSRFTLHSLRFAAIAALLLILLTTTLARPLWRIDLVAATVAYPWQLYALVGPLLALLAGGVLIVERRLAVLPVWAAAVTLVVLSSYAYLAPRFTQVLPDTAAPMIFGAGQVTLVAAETGSVRDRPEQEGSVRDRPEQEGSVGDRPEQEGSVGDRPGHGELPLPLGEGRGEGKNITLAWQALQPIDFDYNVFIHGLDEAGNRVAQWDGQPLAAGEPHPMTAWSVGEIVQGDYRLELDPAAAPVQRVIVGLYNWQTGERLLVNGADGVTLEVGP